MSESLLTGERLVLRKVHVSDVNENYHKWMNDAEVVKFLESRFQQYSLEDIKNYVKSLEQDKNNLFLAILIKGTERHIGNIKLGPINYVHNFAEIGLMIGEKDCWGKGYASEAIKIISRHAFEELKLNKLTAGCYQSNVGSLKAFEKAGFMVEGISKKHFLCDGQYVDAVRLGLLNGLMT